MDESPAYFPAVSLHLSRVLDEIGLNALTVERRRDTILYFEKLGHIDWRIIRKCPASCFHFGSQTEGTTTPGLNSDIDTLFCLDDISVILSLAQWQPKKKTYLMLKEDTVPGYCRLQALRQDIPAAREDLPHDGFTYDSRGRVILPNACVFRIGFDLSSVRNGPAFSAEGDSFTIDQDYVSAFRCSFWPDQAGEFIRRPRRHGWPSPSLVQQAIQHGVFLVPVGYKESKTDHLEWRISASMTERYLMFSLGMVHIKCYVVLKMMIKTFVQPYVGKCISSYHCKTALLHCTENTEREFWRDENLIQCVERCLVMLLSWVNDGFCPQFIISEENLFAGKVTAQNKDMLKSIITDLIRSKGRALLFVEIDDCNGLLLSKLNTEPSTVPILDSLQTVILVGELECDRHKNIDIHILSALVESKNAAPLQAMQRVCENINTLKAHNRRSDKHERHAFQTYMDFLLGWIGSMMASFLLSQKKSISRKSVQLMRRAAKYDIASALKIASVFYCNGDFRQAEMMLQGIEDHFCSIKVHSLCWCYGRPLDYTLSFCQMMNLLKGRNARSAIFAHCVKFSPQEIHCAPSALLNELHRSTGDDINRRDPNGDNWMCIGVVDCLPFLHYLQFLTFTRLGNEDYRQVSLCNLAMCVKADINFGHRETALNLLGQCMEMENDYDAALECYRASLEVRPRNNAANWHVATLCYTIIQKNGLLK